MRKEEVWCDNCGRQIQLKNVPSGSDDFNSLNKSWDLWGPEDKVDSILCSLQCVVARAQYLMTLEQPLG